MSNIKYKTGQRYGNLIIVRQLLNIGKKRTWECLCDCGNKTIKTSNNLTSSKHPSCGCVHRKILSNLRTTHGYSRMKEHRAWGAMIRRCHKRKDKNYGARGITVCDRWRYSFENFLLDMGSCPENMSIDRINTNGNYEPNNCRWATIIEQGQNTRRNIFVTHNNKTQCLAEWSRELNIPDSTLSYRYYVGYSPDKILRKI